MANRLSFLKDSEAKPSVAVSHRQREQEEKVWPFSSPRLTYTTSLCRSKPSALTRSRMSSAGVGRRVGQKVECHGWIQRFLDTYW